MGMTTKPLFALLPLLWVGAASIASAQTVQTSPTVPTPANPFNSTPVAPEPSRTGLLSGRALAPDVAPEITQTRAMIAAQQWVEAAQLIEAALAKRPRDPQWRFLQSVLFAETGKRSEAITTLELLSEDFPELAEPYNNLAALYVDQNELHKARLLLERAIQNRPDYALAHENLADVYTRLAINAYERAAKGQQPAPSVALKLEHLKKTPAIRQSRVLTTR
jgi:Flp pilus assembly protein TadD